MLRVPEAMLMAYIPKVFDQPGAGFVLLPRGIKFPPIEEGWQLPEKAHAFQEATAHKGNVGILAGNGYIGLDQDNPAAFTGLELPASTTWETRPGRLGMWFKVSDDVAEALPRIGKKPDQAQLKLFKDGRPAGEIKLQRSYQVTPPSWKTLEDGTRADYKLIDASPPATIELSKLLADLQAIGITFSSKLEQNTEKLENMGREARKVRAETDEAKARRYALAALRDEVRKIESAPEGDRNSQLNRSAYSLGQFLAIGVLEEGEVILGLSEAASRAGLDSEEVRATIMSGLDAGRQKPRKIPKKAIAELARDSPEGCDSAPKESMATRLAALARKNCLELWHTPDETGYITLLIDGHREYKKINSKSIKAWLSKLGSEFLQATPSGQAINAVVALLEGIALYDGDEYELFVRKAEHNGKVYVDIGDGSWRVIEISKDGWQIIEDSPVRFYRPNSLLPLPIPEAGGDIRDFQRIVNIAEGDEDSWILFTAWLSQAFWCHGPYTHLHVRGPQGSAKSGLAENTKAIIDPSRAPKRHLPRSARELMMGCQNEAVPSFDNVSSISEEIADTLCIISTGGSSAARALYTNDEESIIFAKCPVIMNGIADPSQRGDLLDRLIVLDLNQIPESERISEKAMRERIAEYGPKLLGVILDATVTGLLNIDGVNISNSPRMADFVQWAVACSPSLGWDPETFITIYNESRQEIQQEMAETNRLMRAITRLANGVGVWTGSSTQLLDVLNFQESIQPGIEPDDWPRSAKTVGTDVRRLVQPALSQGVIIRFFRSHGKNKIEIRKSSEISPEEGVCGVGSQNSPTPKTPSKTDIKGGCGVGGVSGVCSFLKVHEYRKGRDDIENIGEQEKKERNREAHTPPTPNLQIAISQNPTYTHLHPPTPERLDILVLGEIKQFVGVDMADYGPYRPEDVATLPARNARNLAAKNLARIISEAGGIGPHPRRDAPTPVSQDEAVEAGA